MRRLSRGLFVNDVLPGTVQYAAHADANMLEAYVAADMNCDGTINAFDVDAFTLALTNPTLYYQTYPTCDRLNGDMNGDGDTDWDDYDLFVEWLTGHNGARGTRQVYAWDAENRLIAVGPPDDMTPVNGTKRATYAYDYMGRRIEKKVYTWQTTPPPAQWVLTEHRRFVWAGTGGDTGGSSASGWLMLMELDGLNHNAVVRKYTWGLDLAGQSGGQTSGLSALEAAGGIGGLLAVEQPGSPTLKYVYFYDGNGNVGQLIDPLAASASASIKVKYEYDPYGTRTNSPQAGEFDQPFRFSTKYFDAETSLSYFGHRYYHPKLGRWMSRDPLGETGTGGEYYSQIRSSRGDNLYWAMRNCPQYWIDSLGAQADPGPSDGGSDIDTLAPLSPSGPLESYCAVWANAWRVYDHNRPYAPEPPEPRWKVESVCDLLKQLNSALSKLPSDCFEDVCCCSPDRVRQEMSQAAQAGLWHGTTYGGGDADTYWGCANAAVAVKTAILRYGGPFICINIDFIQRGTFPTHKFVVLTPRGKDRDRCGIIVDGWYSPFHFGVRPKADRPGGHVISCP